MNSAASKHPKKKRRIDDGQEQMPGPSSAVMPLVAPHLVKKSSKDPNRSMYPSSKKKSSHFNHASSPEFVKASELVMNEHHGVKLDVKVDSSSDDDEAPQEQIVSDVNEPSTSKSKCDSKSSKKQLLNHFPHTGKRRANIPSSCSTIKITRFFKPSDNSHAEGTRTDISKKRVVRSVVKHKDRHRVQTSSWSENWHKKNEQLLDAITDNEQFFKHYHDCYGLVENSVPEEIGEDYFKRLPSHVIETILCQIPMLDFMNCRLVCSRWREVIDNWKFMEWKKRYYRYRRERSKNIRYREEKYERILDFFFLSPLEHKTVEDCIGSIVKFMGKHLERIPCSDMYNLLIQNPHGELADHVLSERFPEWNGKDSRVWCQFAIAVIICETVWDILEVYKSLFTSKSCCIRPDVNDALYSIAILLLYFQSEANINCGLHYRVYYTLYLIENNIPFCQREKVKRIKNIPGQQSIHNYSKSDNSTLTYEQIRILNHRFDLNQKIKIIALAGTGKTTTLVHLARLYPQIKFLNLVFNRSVNEEAKKKFPPNVTCRTAHALAFSAVGKFLRHKLTSTLRPYDLIGNLSHNEEHIQIYTYANLVLTTINNFTVSNSTAMCLTHVPLMDFNRKTLSHANRDRILMDAYKIWQKMIDEENSFRLTHDVYLKLYHLKQPKLNKFQCIMVDEAQDCNPVILDIVLSQTMPVLFVGDPHQQIYGFRGAQNALQNIKATHTYHLTKSFRFGPQISYIASCVLDILLNSKANILVGNMSDSNLCAQVSGQYAVIARTNNMLFNEALRMIVFKRFRPYEPTVIRAAFAGDVKTYGFDQILDIYKLKCVPRVERQLQDKFISRFKTYNDLVNYARYSDDTDLISKIEIVNQHGHDISKFITILNEKCNSPIELANVVFATAHKSKGLEFDTVSLTDDYPISTVPGFLDCESSRDEANILYVAITRAKKCLLLPEKITKILHLAHEKFEYPVSSKALLKTSPELKCIVCNSSFVPHTVLVMLRRKTIMASGREIPEGPLCMKCSSDPYMRPDVHMNNLIMYLDPTQDNCHRFMSKIVGPLPDDPPIIHDRFSEFDNADRIFVINLNIH